MGLNLNKKEEPFNGYECLRLDTEKITVWVARTFGPRIIGLAPKKGENIFALIPGESIDYPGGGRFIFHGGHRLWYAPENPWRTYIPDNAPVEIEDLPNGVTIIQPVEKQTGIQKSITIATEGTEPKLYVEHRITNLGTEETELAPWAITQMRPGGFAILPQTSSYADLYGLLPNRHISLWPYTKMNSPHIKWGDRFIFVMANMEQGSLKIGFPNRVGWIAYLWKNILFVKYAQYDPNAEYYDGGSSSECYCCPTFLELETLGPKVKLKPGEFTIHRETWVVLTDIEAEPVEEDIEKLVQKLKL